MVVFRSTKHFQNNHFNGFTVNRGHSLLSFGRTEVTTSYKGFLCRFLISSNIFIFCHSALDLLLRLRRFSCWDPALTLGWRNSPLNLEYLMQKSLWSTQIAGRQTHIMTVPPPCFTFVLRVRFPTNWRLYFNLICLRDIYVLFSCRMQTKVPIFFFRKKILFFFFKLSIQTAFYPSPSTCSLWSFPGVLHFGSCEVLDLCSCSIE